MGDEAKSIEDRLDALEEIVKNLRDTLMNAHKHTVASFKTVDENFEIVNTKIDTLVASSEKGFDDVGGKIDDLQVEVKKIQKVSNYPEEYENLLKISR